MKCINCKNFLVLVIVLLLTFSLWACDESESRPSSTTFIPSSAPVNSSPTASYSASVDSFIPSSTASSQDTTGTPYESSVPTGSEASGTAAVATGDIPLVSAQPTQSEQSPDSDVPSINAKYCVRRSFEDFSTEIGKYESLDEAKLMADVNAHMGYVVFDMDGNFLYSKYSQNVTKILYNAKILSDFIVENGFTLGNPTKNPAVNSSELLINGDSYVGWVLYRCGFVEGQPTNGGLRLNKPGSEANLAEFCAQNGFTKITDIGSLKAGDIVFYGEVDGISGFAGGVLILASDEFEDETNYIYDFCYDLRIEEMQPMRESIIDFMFAYRID